MDMNKILVGCFDQLIKKANEVKKYSPKNELFKKEVSPNYLLEGSDGITTPAKDYTIERGSGMMENV